MKKFYVCLVVILLSVGIVFSVYGLNLNIFKLDFNTKEESMIRQDMYSFNNGYYKVTEVVEDEYEFSVLDNKGNVSVTKSFSGNVNRSIVYDNYLYISYFLVDNDIEKTRIYKYNDKLEIVDSFLLDEEFYLHSISKNGMLFTSWNEYIVLDLEMNSISKGNVYEKKDSNDVKRAKMIEFYKDYDENYFKVLTILNDVYDSIPSSHYLPLYSVDGDNILFGMIITEDRASNTNIHTAFPLDGYYIFDTKGNLLYHTIFDKNKMITDISLVHGYVVMSLYDGKTSKIEVYSTDGKLLETISAEKEQLCDRMYPTASGFSVMCIKGVNLLPPTTMIPQPSTAPPEATPAPVKSSSLEFMQSFDNMNLDKGYTEYVFETAHNEVYTLVKNIKTKVVGKGKVEVTDSSMIGGMVTFKIEPEEGYVLKKVKVTDSDGNVVEFTTDTFKMPSSDVLIEAEFVPEVVDNPKTGIIDYIALLILIEIVLVGTVYYFRNKGKFRNI